MVFNVVCENPYDAAQLQIVQQFQATAMVRQDWTNNQALEVAVIKPAGGDFDIPRVLLLDVSISWRGDLFTDVVRSMPEIRLRQLQLDALRRVRSPYLVNDVSNGEQVGSFFSGFFLQYADDQSAGVLIVLFVGVNNLDAILRIGPEGICTSIYLY